MVCVYRLDADFGDVGGPVVDPSTTAITVMVRISPEKKN
jgi:hypothetical protein